ncbi:MAG: dihydroorotate dehydrogenase, partial [Victivallales bacterium]|nr:dihydroorotate dehydrogenase [Victivallales bacterium]
MADLSVDLCGMRMRNPVMTASGTFGYGRDYLDFFSLSELGAIVVKGVAVFESRGNPTPRVAEVASGMLNSIGLQGPGLEKFLTHPDYLPFLRGADVPVIVNIWGKTVEQYAEVAAGLVGEDGVAALEINISCPNVKEGGVAFGTDPVLAAEVVAAVRSSTTLPLITKLSPNVSDIAKFADIVVGAGSDMVSLINTLSGMAIDIETRRPRIANVTGGLSGPAIKPVALRMVYEAANAVDVPIIGMGGIMTGEDAVEFF